MKRFSLAILALVVATGAQAASEKVEMNLVTSQGVVILPSNSGHAAK